MSAPSTAEATWVAGAGAASAAGVGRGGATGAEIGAGLDLSTLTFDASYEKGLTDEFHGSNTKRNVIRGVFGVKL